MKPSLIFQWWCCNFPWAPLLDTYQNNPNYVRFSCYPSLTKLQFWCIMHLKTHTRECVILYCNHPAEPQDVSFSPLPHVTLPLTEESSSFYRLITSEFSLKYNIPCNARNVSNTHTLVLSSPRRCLTRRPFICTEI